MITCRVLPLFLFTLAGVLNASSVDVSGNITSSVTWNVDTVGVIGDVTIDNGITLTVAPGTYVEFQGYYALNVQGRILAQGAVNDSIVFIARDTTEGWHGIRFDSTSSTNDTSRLSYCKLQYGRGTGSGKDLYGGALFLYSFSKLVISNAEIRNNSVYGAPYRYGGGIYCNNSSPIVKHTIISNNDGGWGGGGIYCCRNSSPQLTGVTINNNSGDIGGGICCDSSSPALDSVTIGYNIATQGSGLYLNNSSPTLTDVTIAYNWGGGGNYGGGVYCSFSSPTLIRVTISNNHTSYGGGFYCGSNSSPTLINVAFNNNKSLNSGGGIYCYGSSPILTNVIFNNDSASLGAGGGIVCDGSSPILTDVIFCNNRARSFGGGMSCLRSSSPRIINATFSNNTADSGGGGIYCLNRSSPKVTNTILWFNTSKSSSNEVYLSDTTCDPDFNYCNIRGGNGSFQGGGAGLYYGGSYLNNLDADPLFSDTAAGTYSLQASSPCIDSGTPDTTGLSLPSLDLAGNSRIYGGRVDIGAYEYQGPNAVFLSKYPLSSPFVSLHNGPNPFTNGTTIYFTLPPSTVKGARVDLVVYNVQGQIIRNLFQGNAYPGSYSVRWGGNDAAGRPVPSGIYFCKLTAGSATVKIGRMILQR